MFTIWDHQRSLFLKLVKLSTFFLFLRYVSSQILHPATREKVIYHATLFRPHIFHICTDFPIFSQLHIIPTLIFINNTINLFRRVTPNKTGSKEPYDDCHDLLFIESPCPFPLITLSLLIT